MPVTDVHPIYKKLESKRKRSRDATDGDKVKAAGAAYLPMLDGMSDPRATITYEDYKRRALYYAATSRTIDGYTGLVFRRPAVVSIPGSKQAADIIARVGMRGEDAETFALKTLTEDFTLGNYGIYITLPTQASPTARAYAALYRAENVINWDERFDDDSGEFVFTRVVLKESIYIADPADPFGKKAVEQYRVLYLREGAFFVDIYREATGENGAAAGFQVVERHVPTVRGKTLDFIPFIFDPEEVDPPILGLADANLDHYRLMADYRHGLHFTGLPTYYGTGVSSDDDFTVGSATFLLSSEPDAKFGIVEFTGQGLGAVEKAIASVESYMGSLGAKLLTPEKAAIEAADTHRIKQGREESVIAQRTRIASKRLSRAYTWLFLLSSVPGEARLTLNTDLVDAKLSAQAITALVSAWQSNALSKDSLLYNFKRGELLPEDRQVDEEKEILDAEAPAMLIEA